ncbi:21505_t:CDS:2, partial [Racocetra persica]
EVSRPITENIVAPYIIRETEEERQTRNLSNEISGLRLDMDNFQTNMQELLERRSEVGTTVFEEQQQQLETQMAETQTRLNELQARYNAIPEEIRRSIRKILGWNKKKKEEIQEQVKALNTELQVQKVEQAIEQLRQERVVKKPKKAELVVDKQSEEMNYSDYEANNIGNVGDNKHFNNNLYNKFHGSLEPLKKLIKLKDLHISNTDIDSGLEYLPDSVEEFHCSAEKNPERE